MGYYEAVSASAPILWWRMSRAVPVNPETSYHRYWRVTVTQSAGGNVSAGEIEFHSAAFGPNMLASTSTVTASTAFATPTYVASKAVDGNTSTWWVSAGGVPQWWSWDVGAGNSASVAEVKWTARTDVNYPESPVSASVQYSDDNTNWTKFWDIALPAWTSSGQSQTAVHPGWLNVIPNEGVGSSSLTGIFSSATGTTFRILTGTASASNPAYNVHTGNTGAFYLAQNGNYALYSQRVHDFDFFNLWDPANTSASWTVEWWAKYTGGTSYNYPWVGWHWGGWDGSTDGLSCNPENISLYMWGQNPANWQWTFYSGTTQYAYRCRCFEDVWRSFNVQDGSWYHIVMMSYTPASYASAPTVKFIINGNEGVTQADNVGATWITTTASASPNYYIRSYSGGTRIGVGSCPIPTYGASAGQQGLISDFAIYNRCLSASEIMDHWMAGRRIFSGTLLESEPVYTVHVPAQPINVPQTGSQGARDARASKLNPGTN